MYLRRAILPITALLLVLAALADLGAAPEDVSVGNVRAVVARDGTSLRERPSSLAKAQTALPHAAKVRVEEVRGRWIRVSPVGGASPGARGGWLRASQTVEPFALTTAGRGAGRAGRTTGGVSSSEISAAGRQFDPATEASFKKTRADLQRAYPLVDRIEDAKPDPEALQRFLNEGRLGRPAGRGE